MDYYRLLPKYWLQNERTCMKWDRELNKLMDTYTPVKQGYTTKFGSTEVWTQNWPYAYGDNCEHFSGPLPTVKTRKRLKEIVDGLA